MKYLVSQRSLMYTHFSLLTIVFIGMFSELNAQSISDYDGIAIEPSNANESEWYYGEPFHVYFKISNSKNSINPYYLPSLYVNIRFYLKDLSTGELITNLEEGWDIGTDNRTKHKEVPPSMNRSFKPNQVGYYGVHVGKFFGTDALTDKKYQHNRLTYYLRAIPVGKYELIFEYYLHPSDEVLKSSYKFEVKDIPNNEKVALEKYIEATKYSCESHYHGNSNYSARNERSYDRFVKDYPNSIFTNHAVINMVTESYYYPNAGPSKQERIAKFEEYIKYYPELRNGALKMKYVSSIPRFIEFIPNKNVKFEADKILKQIVSDDPDISTKLIQSVELKAKITGLQNYAAEREKKEKKE